MPADPRIFFRVDPRLVHATLMNAWVPALGAELIVVADGDVEKDPRMRTILEMSAMDADVEFVSETTVSALVARPGLPTAVVLFSELASALRAVEAGLTLSSLNVGHVPAAPHRREIHPAVHLGPDDLEILRTLEKKGVDVYIQPLPQDSRASATDSPAHPETELREQMTVVNERGLHLRAAHVLAQLASKLEAEVLVGRGEDLVNAKSLLGLTTLGATCGTELTVVVRGPNAADAMAAVRQLFASGFDEGVV